MRFTISDTYTHDEPKEIEAPDEDAALLAFLRHAPSDRVRAFGVIEVRREDSKEIRCFSISGFGLVHIATRNPKRIARPES